MKMVLKSFGDDAHRQQVFQSIITSSYNTMFSLPSADIFNDDDGAEEFWRLRPPPTSVPAHDFHGACGASHQPRP
ncbi:hypothetical protein JTE90_020159 [Oedothorax gibbosus]|uniref:Uncharacterized protein n=1 Tax=Oedothorax gibbosus TaxID=931172 RepID=A0AAV6TXG4_9ARAC|nr:hypothetical protein JTE90_020159 [Oedothorax gibbosus]